MSRPLGRRTCSGEPIMCPGLCNPYNKQKVKMKMPEKQKFEQKSSSRKKLVLLHKLPDLKRASAPKQCCFFPYLKMGMLYVVFHILIGAAAKDHDYYQPFIATQLCGFLTLIMWSTLK